jgi:hypothetical protein
MNQQARTKTWGEAKGKKITRRIKKKKKEGSRRMKKKEEFSSFFLSLLCVFLFLTKKKKQKAKWTLLRNLGTSLRKLGTWQQLSKTCSFDVRRHINTVRRSELRIS